MKKTARALLFVCSMAPFAAMADQAGTVTANYDGQDRQWFVMSVERSGKQIITARFKNSKRLSSLHIQAHPEPRLTTKGIVTIEQGYYGKYEAGKTPVFTEVSVFPESVSGQVWTSARTGNDPVVTFEDMDVSGEVGHAAGTFSGELCLAESLTDDPDTGNCKSISGSFDTELLIR